jgi:hypothetical protein
MRMTKRMSLGGSLSIVTGNRSGGDQMVGMGIAFCHLENAFIKAGDTERLKWTIIKNGATKLQVKIILQSLLQHKAIKMEMERTVLVQPNTSRHVSTESFICLMQNARKL